VIAALLAGWLFAAAAPDQGPDQVFEQRMRDSAAAAQALQGPLDGRWTVTDARARVVYVLQIADAPHAAAPLTAAWSDPHMGALGGVDAISRAGDRLNLAFAPDPDGPPVRLSLRRLKRGGWRGLLTSGALKRPVRLKRD
jgi:hypothetical protein